MEDALLQYGILGIVVIALGYAYLRLEKRMDDKLEKMESRHTSEMDKVELRHKTERSEWLEAINSLFEKHQAIQIETNRTITDTGNIITGLKTLFEVKLKN